MDMSHQVFHSPARNLWDYTSNQGRTLCLRRMHRSHRQRINYLQVCLISYGLGGWVVFCIEPAGGKYT